MENFIFLCSVRQAVGIAMGSDPAPFMVNIFLCYFENKWNLNLKRSHLLKTCSFINMVRFMDLLAINDNGLLKKYFKEIWPEEL